MYSEQMYKKRFKKWSFNKYRKRERLLDLEHKNPSSQHSSPDSSPEGAFAVSYTEAYLAGHAEYERDCPYGAGIKRFRILENFSE